MLTVLIVVVALATLVAVSWLQWRRFSASRDARGADQASVDDAVEARSAYPPSGVLVSEQVMRSIKPGSLSLIEALEQAAVPIAMEYFPISAAEMTRYRTIPINASAQRSVEHIVKVLGPEQPTLYRAVLPKGAELVKAVGQTGFRGFSRTGGKTAQAVLKPVAAGGALAAGWPIFAVAGTVMVVDMLAQREIRGHQRFVESILGRQEERHYANRIKNQRTADAQLTRTISLILDGHQPDRGLALKGAYDEFHLSQQFLEAFGSRIEGLVETDGKIDYRKLEAVIGAEGRDHDFFWQMHMARAALAIGRKALITEAAGLALADPGNPYAAMRKVLDSQAEQLAHAEEAAALLTERLAGLELKGGWSIARAARKRDRIRDLAAGPVDDDGPELLFFWDAAGQVTQVVPDGDFDQQPGLIEGGASTGEAPEPPAMSPE